MKRLMLLITVVGSASALAQTGDEWTNFPSNPPKSQPPPAGQTPDVPPTQAKPKPQPQAQPTDSTPDVPPAGAKPKPTPADAPTTNGEPTPAHQDPNARSRVEERLKAAEQGKPIPQNTNAQTGSAAAPANTAANSTGSSSTVGAPPKPGELPIVSRKEEVLPGTEQHSPSTWNHGLDDDNARVTVGSAGVSVLHTQSPRLGPKGVLRFSTLGEYNNLNDFPVKSAENIRSAITFAASFVPIQWLETYVAYAAYANTNSRTSPNLIQGLGDFTLGAKGALRISDNKDSALSGLYLGLDARLLTFSGVGNQSVDRFAVGFKPAALVAYDLRTLTRYLPVIAHMNLGFTLDSTGGLITNQTLNAAEEFALEIDRYNRFDFALAAEVPLPWVSPFLEYSLSAPLGVPNNQLTGPDGVKVDATSAMPQKLGIGFKITAIKDLTLMAAFDIGLARSVGLGVAATPPWNFLFNLSFNIDPFQRGETKLVETVREREKKVAEAPKTGKIEGIAIDSKTHVPIPGVLVAMVGLGLPPVASDAEAGRFLSYDLPLGPVKLHASRDGYKDIEQELKVELGKPQKIELALEPVEKKAMFSLRVTGTKKAIASAIAFHSTSGAEDKAAATIADVKEPVKVEATAGAYSVTVTADGFLAQNKDVQVTPGAEMELAFDLQPAPKKMLAIIKDDKIEIAQQVHFLTGKATILADSFSLLQQVVDVMVRNNIKRVRVEGHTDNRGQKDFNQKLSEDRAKSVADYLVGQGIDRSRIESAGYGDTRPVAPNLTARGRELNRRVEFLILEK